MGGYSSDSDDSRHRHRSKKHRKRRSRSRSASSNESRSHRRHKKSSKKSKHSRRSRSRSRSSERSHRSRGKRSRSKGSRSKSRSPHSSRRRRTRSRSRSRRSPRSRRSGSRNRSRRSRSRSNTRSERSRKRSNSKSVSRRSSPDSSSRASSANFKSEKSFKSDPCADIPGFDTLPAAKQAELRLQMALKAAALADQKLQNQGLLVPSGEKKAIAGVSSTVEEQQKRQQDIDDIEKDEFEPAMFKSSKSLASSSKSIDTSHADAMFGGGGISIIPTPLPTGKSVLSDVNELFGPIFYVSQEERMERWKKKLMSMRRKKLEGVAMT